jgi:hypothetical protein
MIFIKMFMGRQVDTDNLEVQNKTLNQAQLEEEMRQMKIRNV